MKVKEGGDQSLAIWGLGFILRAQALPSDPTFCCCSKS